MERMRAVRLVDDFFISRPLQEAALELVSSPAVGAACSRAGHRVAGTMRAVGQPPSRAKLPDWTVTQLPTGGLHLWIRLPAGEDDAAVAAAAGNMASPSVPVDATSLPNRRRPSCGWGSQPPATSPSWLRVRVD